MTEHHILVLSDSHGRRDNILTALERQIHRPDVVLFLGDGLRDIGYVDFGNTPVHAVSGNCDGIFVPSGEPDERTLYIGNLCICMMHGHKYMVKSGRTAAAAHAAKLGADILLFGHTHETVEDHLPAGFPLGSVTLQKPLTVFNPGTIGGISAPATFGTITIRDGVALCGHGKIQ